MALQVWLPLNGDLHNQGLSRQINNISTTPVWAPIGKIGKNALYTKTRMTIMNFPELEGVSIYSVAYWLYIPTEVAPTAWSDMFGIQFNCGGTNVWERDERRAAATTGRHNYHLAKSGSEGANTNAYYGTKEDDSANDNWIHVVLTKDNDSAKLYFNGQLQVTVAASAFEDAPRTMTGNIYLGSNGCEAYLQDFRIYDHCLSKKEIEEISKGLVLHYKLDGFTNITNPNLIKDSAPTTQNWSSAGSNWANSLVECSLSPSGHAIRCSYSGTTQTSGGMYKGMYDINLIENGATYTLSGWIRASKNCKVSFKNEWMVGISQTNITTEWKYYKVTGVMDTSKTYKSDVCYMVASYVEQGVWIEAFGFKLEKGNDATPWIPHTTDALYAGYFQDLNIVYDSSGYRNNGTITGTIITSSNTPRYIKSSCFDGTAHIINNTSTIHLSNEFTISWWGKINSWKKKWEGMFMLQNTTALNGASGTYSIGNAFNANTANSMALSIRQGGTTYPLDRYAWTYSIGTWEYYACTYKAGVVIMYQNGTQVYTATIADSSSNDYYYTIGRRVQNSDCQMSDFRIYETALTAEQIKELYDTSATVDKEGNFYIREVVE